MADAILVLNAGSSSLKFRAYKVDATTARAAARRWCAARSRALHRPHFSAADATGERRDEHLGARAQLGHAARSPTRRLLAQPWRRPQPGGGRTPGRARRGALHPAVRVTDEVIEALASWCRWRRCTSRTTWRRSGRRATAAGTAAGGLLRHRLPPQPAREAQAFALPQAITSRGVRRYGFHGLSYEYIASRAAGRRRRRRRPHRGGAPGQRRQHVRAAAAAAWPARWAFTAVDGLVMGTRCGNRRPGVILYLMDELKHGCARHRGPHLQRSGLLGVSGISSDMRTLLASDEARARFAVELFTYRIGRELGSLAAARAGSTRSCSPAASASARR
jgi:acetate kinase